ncbi:MAG: hypothetical protein ABJ308_17445 [Halieaceae bacterium]
MEKILYPVWKPDALDPDAFRELLLQEVAPALVQAGVRGLRISVVDSEVAAAAGLRQETLGAALDAMLSVWLDSSVYRQEVESIIAARVARMDGYLVTESEPLKSGTAEGERTSGMAQVVFLQRPERLSEVEWLDIWHGSHTQVAIETQSTFGYRQNVVARALTAGAPVIDAIIEENFPAAAMTSQQAFFGVSTDEELQANLSAMVDSCARFIDFDKINVVPTSEYLIKQI